jgi:hypothetical protein
MLVWGPSTFRAFSVSDFDGVSPSVPEVIFCHPNLAVRDEDSVFGIVHRLASEEATPTRFMTASLAIL